MMPMPHVGAYLGGLWNVRCNAAARRVVVQVALPMCDLIPVGNTFGPPPRKEARETIWQEGGLPPVMIQPARAPRHPWTDADTMAEAAADFLKEGLASGAIRFTPALSVKLNRLHDSLHGMSIVSPLPEDLA